MSKQIKVGNIMKIPRLKLLKGIRGRFDVVFDDGVIKNMSESDIVFARYLWEFHKTLDMRITSDFDTTIYYDAGYMTSGTHKKFFAKAYKSYINLYLKANNKLSFPAFYKAWKSMFDILQLLYSELQYNILEYGVSLGIKDYVDLEKDPELQECIANAMNDSMNPEHITIVADKVREVIQRNPDNNLSKMFNSGAANKTQINHSLGIRGFVPDINDMIYSHMIGPNLTIGLGSFYDMGCESSVMAKALKLQEFGVRYSEWLQRELHLASMHTHHLTLDDCGNRSYKPQYLKDSRDVTLFEGTNILLDGVEVEIDAEIHQHLVGTTVMMRRITECKHLTQGKVCYKCLGAITYTMPAFSSISNSLITTLMSLLGQLMLSAKHFTDSVSTGDVLIPTSAQRVMRSSESDVVMKDIPVGTKVSIGISSTAYYGFNLLSASMGDKVNTLDPHRLSSVEKFTLSVESGDKTDEYTVGIRQDGRNAILDSDLIKHSLLHTDIDAKGNYMIDITDYKGRLMFLENKEFAYDQFNDDFKSLLLSISARGKTTVDEMIVKIFNFLNTKLTVNIKIVEMLVASIIITNKKENDYSVSLDEENREVASYKSVITNRGIAIGLGFEGQKTLLMNSPSKFLGNKMPYNPLEMVWKTKNII